MDKMNVVMVIIYVSSTITGKEFTKPMMILYFLLKAMR